MAALKPYKLVRQTSNGHSGLHVYEWHLKDVVTDATLGKGVSRNPVKPPPFLIEALDRLNSRYQLSIIRTPASTA